MAVSKGTVALLHPPPQFCTRWPASHLEVSVSLWMKCQIKCDVKCFYYNPKSQYCTMLHVLIIDSLHIINNNTKMIQRSVSEDPVKMNESFLFSLVTSAEPMQVTWKMNDERWTMNESLIYSLPVLSLCRSREKWTMNDERKIYPKTRLADERNIDPKTRSGGERFVHLPDTDL